VLAHDVREAPPRPTHLRIGEGFRLDRFVPVGDGRVGPEGIDRLRVVAVPARLARLPVLLSKGPDLEGARIARIKGVVSAR
jgi:hypothetical protein